MLDLCVNIFEIGRILFGIFKKIGHHFDCYAPVISNCFKVGQILIFLYLKDTYKLELYTKEYFCVCIVTLYLKSETIIFVLKCLQKNVQISRKCKKQNC